MRLQAAFRQFLVALQFLTIAPPLHGGDPWPEDIGLSVAFYPVVGALIGALLWGIGAILFGRVSREIGAFLLLLIWVASTGALHVDGFLDTVDGLFGGMTPERRLEIMHDVHYGSFAFAGGALLFLGKFVSLQAIGSPVDLLLAPIVGRWGMVLTIWALPYARKEGLGKSVKAGVRPGVVASALLEFFLRGAL
jgi:adenosylcobinamide-GDP ribazoletransferase